jgi:hypothetical protein
LNRAWQARPHHVNTERSTPLGDARLKGTNGQHRRLGVVQPAAYRPDGNTAHGGDVRVGADAAEVTEQGDHAVLLGQRRHGMPHPVAQHRALQQFFRAGGLTGGQEPLGFGDRHGPPGTQLHTAVVAHDGTQPPADGGRVAYVADRDEGGHHGVLHGVFGIRPGTEHAQRHGPHAGLMPRQQCAECPGLTSLRSADQLAVVHHLIIWSSMCRSTAWPVRAVQTRATRLWISKFGPGLVSRRCPYSRRGPPCPAVHPDCASPCAHCAKVVVRTPSA